MARRFEKRPRDGAALAVQAHGLFESRLSRMRQ
jgi:hypothetical protein